MHVIYSLSSQRHYSNAPSWAKNITLNWYVYIALMHWYATVSEMLTTFYPSHVLTTLKSECRLSVLKRYRPPHKHRNTIRPIKFTWPMWKKFSNETRDGRQGGISLEESKTNQRNEKQIKACLHFTQPSASPCPYIPFEESKLLLQNWI